MAYTYIPGPDSDLADTRETFEFSVETTDESWMAEYTFEVVVGLSDWPNVATVTTPFNVYVDPCVVVLYDPPGALEYTYILGDSQRNI